MTILLYKNGQWLIDGEQPLEGVSLDNLAAILTNPSDGDVIKYDEASGLWTAGKDEALPTVSSSDNGKVLAVENGAWAAQKLGGTYDVFLKYDGPFTDIGIFKTSAFGQYDVPSSEIIDAILSGKVIRGILYMKVDNFYEYSGLTMVLSPCYLGGSMELQPTDSVTLQTPLLDATNLGGSGYFFVEFTGPSNSMVECGSMKFLNA